MIVGKAAGKIPEAVTNAAVIIGCLGYMFYLSFTMTLIAASVFALNFVMTVFVMPKLRKNEEGMRSLRYQLFNQLREMVNGLKELNFKSKLRSQYIDKLIGPTTATMVKMKVNLNLLITTFRSLEQLIIMTSIALAIYFVQSYWTQENFLEYFGLVLFLMVPMTRVNSFFRMLTVTAIAIKHIESIGLKLSKLKRIEALDIPTTQWTKNDPLIRFDEISHTYKNDSDDTPFTLGPISFDIYENETVFVIGGNGSGKTTLIKMLTGLYQSQTGELLFKGTKIRKEYLEAYQDHFAALFSDAHVFNLLYHIEDEVVKSNGPHYLEYLGLKGKVRVHKSAEKFSSTNLSYGQLKRLNLTISLLENKEIYVFDEWAANQDPHFKSVFYNVILDDLKKAGKTVVCISHDDAYFDKADRILKMRDGQLVENRNVSQGAPELEAVKSDA
jgi:putative ATP-binding cassette transporter